MNKQIINALLCVSAFACPALAQDTEPEYLDSVPEAASGDKLLQEVVVTASKPLVQTTADKTTYNMEEDPSAQTATVIDALRKVPMVTVDAEGNIKLKGESNFKIYMNGKPNPALSANYKEILRAMPASSIKKVEVITEPGAKYDAEGVGGIINIVTESSSNLNGWTATINANGSNRNVGGGVNALIKLNKFSLSVDYNHDYNVNNGIRQESSVTYLNNPLMHRYVMNSRMDVHGNFDFGSLQTSWEPDSLNLFTANANLINYSAPISAPCDYEMLDQQSTRQWAYKSRADMYMKYLSYTVGANWQHNFRTPNHNIVFLYQYSHNNSHQDLTHVYENYENYPSTIPGVRQEERYPDNEHTFQLDYTLPFAKKHTFEAGAKYILRRNYGDTYQYTSPDGMDWIFNSEASVSMKQHQDVGAIYAAYTGNYGSWILKGGLRYEHARLSSKFRTQGYEDFSQVLNDLVPNLMLSYTLPDYSSVRLSYQMRITRPGMEQLNPYRKEETPVVISYGNPELISQKANNVSLTYTNFTLPVQLNFTLSYNYTDKMILEYQYLGADDISYTTYGNLGHCNQGSLFAYLAYPINQSMKLSANAGCNYTDYKSGRVGVHNYGWGWNASGDFSYQMPWDLELNAYGGAGNSGVSFQGKSSVWSYHGLGITKSLLSDKRLRITLAASNFFTPTQTYRQTVRTPDLVTVSAGEFHSWRIGVNISLRLGSFKGQVKSTAKTIKNDDVQSSDSNSAGRGAGISR